MSLFGKSNNITVYCTSSAEENNADAIEALTNTVNTNTQDISDLTDIVNGNATSFIFSLNDKQNKVDNVSDTEIGYLDGVSSNIQTQIDTLNTNLGANFNSYTTATTSISIPVNKQLQTLPITFSIPVNEEIGTVTFTIPISMKKTFQNPNENENNIFEERLNAVWFHAQYEDELGQWQSFDQEQLTSSEPLPKTVYVQANGHEAETSFEVFMTNVSGSFKFESELQGSLSNPTNVNIRLYIYNSADSLTGSDTSLTPFDFNGFNATYITNTTEWYVNTDVNETINLPVLYPDVMLNSVTNYPDDSNSVRTIADVNINPNHASFNIDLKFSLHRNLQASAFSTYTENCDNETFQYRVDGNNHTVTIPSGTGPLSTIDLLNELQLLVLAKSGHQLLYTFFSTNGGINNIVAMRIQDNDLANDIQWQIRDNTTQPIRNLLGLYQTTYPIVSLTEIIQGDLNNVAFSDKTFSLIDQTNITIGVYDTTVFETKIAQYFTSIPAIDVFTWNAIDANETLDNWVNNYYSKSITVDSTYIYNLTSAQLVYNRSSNSDHTITFPDGPYTTASLIDYILTNKDPTHNLTFTLNENTGIVTSTWDKGGTFRFRSGTTYEVGLLLGCSTVPYNSNSTSIIGDISVLLKTATTRSFRIKIDSQINTPNNYIYRDNQEVLIVTNNSNFVCNSNQSNLDDPSITENWFFPNIDTEFVNSSYGSNYTASFGTKTDDGFSKLINFTKLDKVNINNGEAESMKIMTLTNKHDQDINEITINTAFRPFNSIVPVHEVVNGTATKWNFNYGKSANTYPIVYANEFDGSLSAPMVAVNTALGKVHIHVSKLDGYDELHNGAIMTFLILSIDHSVQFNFKTNDVILADTVIPANTSFKTLGNKIEFMLYNSIWYVTSGLPHPNPSESDGGGDYNIWDYNPNVPHVHFHTIDPYDPHTY
jgi:hypothetical protein